MKNIKLVIGGLGVFMLTIAVSINTYAQTTEELYQQARKGAQAEYERIQKGQIPIQKLKVGGQAIDFTLNDPEDKPVTLASFKGKYVLVDFWASWCHPCRAENPNVLKGYNIYKDKGFTVLSVSMDKGAAREQWLAAVKADKLPWTQVDDPGGFQGEVAKLYEINFIPQNFLLDPQGNVVALNLRGEDLQTKLAELFK